MLKLEDILTLIVHQIDMNQTSTQDFNFFIFNLEKQAEE